MTTPTPIESGRAEPAPGEGEQSLPAFLAARARAASDARLAVDAAGGLVVAIAFVIWRPFAWLVVVSAALCFLAFGAWGIADRTLREHPGWSGRMTTTLRTARIAAAALGAVSAVMLLASGLGILLGTIIS